MAQLPVPVLLPDGEWFFADIAGYYKGDKLPPTVCLYRDRTTYRYDKRRNAYVREADFQGSRGDGVGFFAGGLVAALLLSLCGVPVVGFLVALVIWMIGIIRFIAQGAKHVIDPPAEPTVWNAYRDSGLFDHERAALRL